MGNRSAYFFELKTNHRFRKDPKWGQLLNRYRDHGPTVEDVNLVNSRLLNQRNSNTTIPPTKTNIDRMAINDAIFANHLKETHSKDPAQAPPSHTICIKAAKLQWKIKNSETKKKNINVSTKMLLTFFMHVLAKHT